jgi:hypothetical protein
MGEKNMFDLKKEIAKWRMTLSKKQTCDKSDLDELESHLEDEIDQLKLKGLSEQEAFLVAAHRLGNTDELADEFAKVNESLILRKKLFYAGCGIFACFAAIYAADAVLKISLLLAVALGLRGYTAGTFGSVFALILLGLIMVLLYVVAKKNDFKGKWFSKTADSLKGKVILLTTVLALMIALSAVGIIFPSVVARTVGVNEYAQIIKSTLFVKQFCWLIAPVLLMIFLIYLRPPKYCKLA